MSARPTAVQAAMDCCGAAQVPAWTTGRIDDSFATMSGSVSGMETDGVLASEPASSGAATRNRGCSARADRSGLPVVALRCSSGRALVLVPSVGALAPVAALFAAAGPDLGGGSISASGWMRTTSLAVQCGGRRGASPLSLPSCACTSESAPS